MNQRVRAGIIGCGYWGPNLVRNLIHHEESTVEVVCDAAQDRVERIARLYRVPTTTTDPQELIHSPDVDLVVVATPARTHAALAKAALTAGKHVLIMKPMTTSVEDAEELIDLAKERGLVLAVDHTFVFTGAVRRMRELVASGALGEIFYVDSVRINLGVFQSDVNVIWDLAPHDVSIIDYVLGGVLPTQVSAVGAAHAGSRRENIAYLTMQYGSSIIGHVHVNWLAPAKIRRTIVGGSKQMIVYDDMQPSEKLLIYDKGVTIAPGDDPEKVYGELVSYRSGDVLAPRLDDREALAVEIDEVVNAILRGGPLSSDGYAGLRAVTVLEAAARSARDGSMPIDLDGARSGALTPLRIVTDVEALRPSAESAG
jgi:predicted dehydrogenase